MSIFFSDRGMLRESLGNKGTRLIVVIVLLFYSFIYIYDADFAFSEELEEEANTVLYSDDVITGPMDGFSETSIEVDYIRYEFCDGIKVFNPLNRLIAAEDLFGAEEVRLFRNSGCIRKIKVLRFAQ